MSVDPAAAPRADAGAPGPGPLRAGHLRSLDLTVRRRVDGLLVGDHRATTLGEGTELAQVRPYVVGDDVRRIDWNVTARTGEPHVRAHVAERAVEHLAPARHVGVDDLRDGRPAQVGRRRGRRARRRPRRVAARQPGRGRDVRRSRCRRLSAIATAGEAARAAPRPAKGSRATSPSAPPRSARRATVRHGTCGGGRSSSQSPTSAVRTTGGGRCCGSSPATTSSRSRSAIAASTSCRTSARSGSSTPRRAVSSGSTPATDVCASGSPRQPRPSVTIVARAFRSVGVPHVVVSTSGDWLRTLSRFLQIETVRR